MINFDNLLTALNIMWKGMAGLFTVCIFVMLLTMLITKIIKPKEKE
jgi:Na+-transporting methylmalonyl-CoA/oxaloacetate decarboxylase gamma subunit